MITVVLRNRMLFPVLAVLLLAGATAQGFTLFPNAKDRSASLFRRADVLLTRADAAMEGGNPDQAQILYEQALKRYEELNQTAPDLHDGLPRFRVDYCRNQLAALQGKLVDNTDPAAEAAARAAIKQDRDAPGVPQGESARFPVPFRRGRSEPVGAGLPAPQTASAEFQPPATTEVRPDATGAAGGGDADEPAPPSRTPPNPAQIAADLRAARARLEDDQVAEASRILVDLLREDPDNRSARMLIALVRTRQGRGDEALVALEDLRGQSEDLPLLLALAGAYCGAGRHFDAMLTLDKAIKLAPEHPYPYLNLAWLSLAMNSAADGRRDAEVYYRRAVKLGATRDRTLEMRLGLDD